MSHLPEPEMQPGQVDPQRYGQRLGLRCNLGMWTFAKVQACTALTGNLGNAVATRGAEVQSGPCTLSQRYRPTSNALALRCIGQSSAPSCTQTPQAPNSPSPLPCPPATSQAGSESPSPEQASGAGGLKQTPQAPNSPAPLPYSHLQLHIAGK